MWFNKLSLKAAALVLAGMASSAFAQALAPLQITADDWNYLSNFKLFGQTGLSFGNQDEFPNEAGWVGTADGDLYSASGKNNGVVGGAIIVGGTIHPHSNMRFTTGPIRYGTGFTSGVYNGSVRCDGLTTSGSCKDVPLYRKNLVVPSAGTISGITQSVPDRQELKIEMPYKGSYDVYFSSLSLGAEAALIIELPDKKHAARLFINQLNVDNHPMFLVKYKNENGYRCIAPNNKFQLSGKDAECVGDYEGNLVVYVNHDIKFKNTDNYPMDGTFIFNGTAEFVSNFMFSGQIFAKELKLGDDINGKNFKFVKVVDPPKIILSQRSATFKESNSWYEIGIGLDSDQGEKDVTFDYCFEFQGSDIPGKFAIPADVDVSETEHDFPICGKATGHVTIPKGKTVAQDDDNRIFIKPLIDGFVEESSDGEKLWLKVSNVQGAEVSSVNYDASHGFNVFITDVDKIPSVSSSLVINVNEDESHTFTKAEFKFEHNVTDRPKEGFKSVIITSLPTAGMLTFKSGTTTSAVVRGQEIAVADLGNLVYTPKADEFGNNYATFKYKVVRTGAGDDASIQSKENTATVNVIPVNDKPSVADAVFNVNELDKTVTGGPITVTDISIAKGKELGVDTYTYELVNVSGSDYAAFKSTFEIVPSDKGAKATIKVKSGAVLNYSEYKQYVVYAKVTDNAATETQTVTGGGAKSSDQFKITVRIQNENDAPTIENQTFTIAEKQDDGSDWPVGTFVGNVVASDPDDDPLTYSVVTTGVPFKFDGSKKLVVADGSVLDYETKSTWTFKVQVSDGDLSASATVTVELTDVNEKPDPRKIKTEYSINENSAKDALVGTFEVFDNDKISGSFEKLTYTLTGALTGAADVTIAKKNLSDIFYLEEEIKSDGTRVISIRVKNSSLLDYEALYKTSSKDAVYTATITIKDTENPAETRTTKIAILDVNEDFTATGGTFYVQEHSLGNTNVCVDKHTADGVCVGDNFGKVEANDPDVYNTSYHKLTYTIDSQKNKDAGYSEDASSFVVDNLGYIKTSANADFEADGPNPKLTYTFLVTVSDVGFSHDVKVIVKVENIEEPIIEIVTEGEGKVHENTATNFVVDKFSKESITDPDMLDKYNAIGDIYEYEIGPVEGLDGDEIFYVDPEKGWISVNAGSKLDYEALFPQNSYTVNIVAKGDKGNLSIGRTIIVLDVNEKPVSHDTIISVDETIADGDVVFTLWATDPDSCSRVVGYMCKNGSHPEKYNKLSYAIVDGANLPFEINQSTGEISLKQGEKLRYIEKQQYVFNVKISDRPVDGSPVLSTTAKVTINVEDVNEPSEFRVISDLYDVDENKGANAVLNGGNIVVYDEDEADVNKITISITDKDATAALDAAKIFEVYRVGSTDETTHLTKFAIRAKKDLNYEELYKKTEGDAVFNVKLSIKDGSGTSTTHETTLRVNDVNEEPAFAQDKYEFKIKENVTVATELGQAKATDPDEYNTSFNTLYFSLDGDDAALFDIDARTGMISSISNAKFDFETKPVYVFEAVVTDGEFTKTATVTVNVEDVSETPVLEDPPPPMYVDENTKKGTKVGVIVATDDDCKGTHKSTCALPTFSLTATDLAADDYKAFYIESDGSIRVKTDDILNYEVKNDYSVRVVATDGDDPTLSTFVDVTINVNDVNDKPTYAEKEYVFEIHENAPIGEFVGSVEADDEDTWSELSYALSDYEDGSKDASVFKIVDGKIYLNAKTLNYETKKQYQVVAKATDNGKSYGAKIGRTDFVDYTATTLVTINLIDDPDEPKIEDDGKKSYDVAENTDDNNTPNGTEIACYKVTDEDKGQLATLVAYVTDVGNTNADRIFDAKMKKDSLCLIVKDASKLNYETSTHTHKINVAVMDADRLTAKVEKTINVVDVNEMPIIIGSKVFTLYEGKGEDYSVGKLYPDDIDTSKAFIDNVFTAVGGDTDLFTITEDGKIKTKRDFDYEEEPVRTFELEVALSDRNKTKYPKLTTKTTITINLKNVSESPEITSKEFSVFENSPADSLIGVIDAVDPDGDTEFLFSLVDESPYVTVKPNGEIRVKEGAKIDYEKMQKFTIKVKVRDIDGSEGIGEIVIKVIDVNEPPKIEPQEFTFPEDSKPGTKKGPVEAKDPDTKNPKFSDLKFYPVEENEKFEIKENGDIVLKGELDYESQKNYVIKVYVTDGQFKDTTDVTIKVGNVVEKSEVEITRVEAGDSVYIKPPKNKPIYTNQEVITVEWTQDGKTKSSLDSLKEGCQYIIKKYKAPDKDVEGADTIEVCYSTAAPIVDIDADKIKVIAENIYTIVETVDKKDTSVYVNNKTKDVEVSVIDTAYSDEGSKYKKTFNVTVVLDTVAVSDKTVKEMVEISKSEITLEKNPKSDVKTKPVGDKTKVSYDKVVNGDSVTVSYFTNDKGEIIKTTVIDENGEKKNIEVIEVSKTVEVKGKPVVVSYKADAETGKILYGDSEGNLMVNVPKSSSSSSEKDSEAVDLKTGVGAFTVTYDAKGSGNDKTMVSYAIDEKGNIPSNEEGDRGYLVTYSYTNKYGNSADKSVFMVLDKRAPIVKILTPSDGDVVYANYVDVDWCIAIDGDEKNCVKQDTLKFQSLNKGVNRIKRIYRDKAGNETIAEIQVMMKKAKDVNISLEDPMVIVSIDSVRKYYDDNPPEKDQKYAVSILNPTTQTEKEVIKGFKKDTKKGSGSEPYPGFEGGHIGPTVTVDMKVPLVSAVGGLATLDDIVINGNMIPLDGVDADNSEKATVEEYVEKYCSAEFKEELGKDYSKALLYSTTARVTLWFYTTGGQFVDKYHFDYDIDDPEMVDKAGLVKFFFEMKPDINGELRDKNGRLYGTGPYIVKTKVDIRSTQRCVVPPVDKSKVGDVLKSSDEMLKRFGYRRPVLRGNEKSSETSKKEDKKEDKKDEKKSDEKKK